jgi:hypothetical protein
MSQPTTTPREGAAGATGGKFKMPPRRALIIGGSAAALVALYVWYRRRQSAATAAATTDTSSADSTGSDNLGGASDGILGVGGTGLGPAGMSAPADNAQWSAQATQALTAAGDDPTAVASALGAYITGQAVTDIHVADLISQAIAYTGYPPVAGAGGYPPAINRQLNGGQSSGTGTANTGQDSNLRPARPDAPHATAVGATSVSLSTAPVPGATLYEWSVDGANHSHTSSPQVTISGLHSRTAYRFSVEAQTATARGDNSTETLVTTH